MLVGAWFELRPRHSTNGILADVWITEYDWSRAASKITDNNEYVESYMIKKDGRRGEKLVTSFMLLQNPFTTVTFSTNWERGMGGGVGKGVPWGPLPPLFSWALIIFSLSLSLAFSLYRKPQ